ncbi:spheroidene monooxygenase [Pontibacter qinzhouensis]|uniref:Spheroidene monooxygenase n=1 Tax=Pontibacter qinzhouensis TaxID=2603253 RepID=A0A5C8IW27_9BACT|nr:spheroidene monooxygenase [Pontibacter qinzhouensis]TXK25022.1 spheroidene monooxygenase [Pontibacter qinzhouensis]
MQSATATSARITTLTLFGLKKGHIRWGLAQMGTSVKPLNVTPGLLFYKLLGSGVGKGFSLQPNFRRYGLLCTWESGAAAEEFFKHAPLLETYRQHSEEIWTVWLHTLQSHGLWSGESPFAPFLEKMPAGPVAVLTRASVNWLALPSFIKYAPAATRALDSAAGLLCSIGLGELPFVRQATFSIWESAEAIKAYAYKDVAHQEVIKRTRSENWYSEELFARFSPFASEGTWQGKDPLHGHLLPSY